MFFPSSMNPCSKKALTVEEILFNYCLSRNRCVIGNVFGIWINRFRIFAGRASFKSSRPDVFCKKGVLRNFAKFTGKHLCQSVSILIKLQALGLQLY